MALVLYYDTNGVPQPVDVTEGSVHVLLQGEDGVIKQDEATLALTTIDFVHHEIHEGDFFEYINAQDIAGATTISFVVITPDTTKWAHFGFEVSGELEFDLQVFEGATPAANGTLVSSPGVINANRNSLNTHTTHILSLIHI